MPVFNTLLLPLLWPLLWPPLPWLPLRRPRSAAEDATGDTIVVTALRTPVAQDRVSSSITVLDQAAIERAQPLAMIRSSAAHAGHQPVAQRRLWHRYVAAHSRRQFGADRAGDRRDAAVRSFRHRWRLQFRQPVCR
jgi:hypothetical protein